MTTNEKKFDKHAVKDLSNRQLAGNELYFSEKGGYVDYKELTNSLILHSKIDFNNDKSIVQRALLKWKAMHPLLNVKVEYKDEKTARFKAIEEEYKFENILFLSLGSNEQTKCDSSDDDLVFRILVEREANVNIDVTAEILWRMVFYKFKNTVIEDGKFKYAIILTVKHTIADFKNLFDHLYGKILFI
jgi:hypothetical protein